MRAISRLAVLVVCAWPLVVTGACGGTDFIGLQPGGDDDGSAGGDASPSDGSGGDSKTDGPRTDGGAGDGGGTDASPGDGGGKDAPADAPATCPNGSSCIDPPPSGWSGPFEFYAGGGPSPACPSDYSVDFYDGNQGLSAAAAQCSCTCGSPSGVQCSTPSIDIYNGNQGCSGWACQSAQLPSGSCVTVDPGFACINGGFGLHFQVTDTQASGGACTPSGGGTVPPAAWTTVGRECSLASAPSTTGCKGGQLCVPNPAGSPWAPTLCISQSGDVPCPSGQYKMRQLFYGSYDDTRDCTQCACDPPAGATCTGNVTHYESSNGSCTLNSTQAALPLACTAVGAMYKADWKTDYAPSGGSCNAQGGQATGTATPTQPTTVCCAL